MSLEGFGSTFGHAASGTAAAGTFTELAGLLDITPPEASVDDVETTAHDNTSKSRTFRPGLVDNGEAQLSLHYSATAYAAMVAIKGVEKAFRIKFSDGSGIRWDGYIKSLGTEIDMEGNTTITATAKVSGDVTEFAAPA